MTQAQKQRFVALLGQDPARVPEVETFEFGSLRWNEFASSLGARLFTAAVEEGRLDIEGLEWGFSETYTGIPERLRRGQPACSPAAESSGYHLMIKSGEISGGAGVPAECVALEGFHAVIPWACYAHSSFHCFNSWTGPAVGGREDRAAQQAAMLRDLGIKPRRNLNPPTGAVWPDAYPRPRVRQPVGAQLGVVDVRTAEWPPRLQRSPELEGLPETEFAVPLVSAMTGEQKARFMALVAGPGGGEGKL